ncbi:MAG: sigma-70 family RNA polymerase sigma factor [Lachnospiraceae bacterium]|nr:sigma-70 family RNA polymerase sigma factor [Lachnospiraceae bacterium]
MRSEQDVEQTIDRYADTVYRVCVCYLKNPTDREDIFQTVFMKYMLFEGDFSSEEHRKAWLIRVTANACKDQLKTSFWKKSDPLDVLEDSLPYITEGQEEVLESVLELPEKYRIAIYLYYYEGYSAAEIAEVMDNKENTVYSLLSRGRGMLKKKLGGELDE